MLSFSPLRNFVRRLSDDRGNVAIVVAISMAPIGLATLGAIDIARATSSKVQLQDALDAAALGAARSNATTDPELQTVGERFLRQNLRMDSDFHYASSSFRFGENGKIMASANMTVRPYVAGLITGGDMAIGASTEVVRADMKLEIALVLDNTGSMLEGSPTKLSRLKTAATNFITEMEEAAAKSTDPNAIKIAIVPFSNTVRIDETVHRFSSWVDQGGQSPINDEIFTTATGTQHINRFSLFATLGVVWRGCVEVRKAPYDVQDDPPIAGATLYTPLFAVDEPDSKTTGYDDDYLNDYVPDGTTNNNWRVRQGMIDKYRGSKKGSMTTRFGPNRGCGIVRMERLTTDYTSLKAKISSMVADGNTNIPIGLAWGWNMLSPTSPYSDGANYGTAKLKKVIVLMTDGENTMSTRDTPNSGDYAGTGYVWQGRILKANNSPLAIGDDGSERTNALDSRLSKLCTNIKNKGIELYTIRVEVSSGSSTLLKNCATADNYFYNVTNAAQLDAAFQSVAGQIAALHLAK